MRVTYRTRVNTLEHHIVSIFIDGQLAGTLTLRAHELEQLIGHDGRGEPRLIIAARPTPTSTG